MRKLFGVFLILVSLALGCEKSKKAETVEETKLPAPATGYRLSGPKKRVGIFEFKNKSRYGQAKLGSAAADVLYSELDKSGLFKLYERTELPQLEKEFELIEAGKIAPISAAEQGKWVGLQAVVIGTVSQFGIWEEAVEYPFVQKKKEIAEATVDIRVVEVSSSKVIYADSGTGRTERIIERVAGFGGKASFDETMADKALRAAISQFLNNLVKRVQELPWEGRVVDVERQGATEVIYVDAGLASNMPMGAKLNVFQMGGKITHPETGEFLGYKKSKIGEAVVFDFSGEDLSLAKMVSGGGVKKGDIVSYVGE